MRRLALLVAGGALWLILAALPASADGGPHNLAANNGTSGLSGDCAACHRAHTAKAANLLKDEMPGLCTSCHDGNGATTDVESGVQYVPTGTGGPTTTLLGALRGGGFVSARIGVPARLSYTSGTSVRNVSHVSVASSGVATTSQHEGTGTVWGNGAVTNSVGSTGVALECASCHNPHGNGQYRILQTKPGGDFPAAASWSAPAAAVEVQDVANPTNAVRNYTVLPGNFVSDLFTGTTPKYDGSLQGDYWRYKYDVTGASNWTTTSLKADPMNTGWYSITTVKTTGTPSTNVAYPTNAAGITSYVDALRAALKATDPISGATVPASGNGTIALDNRGGLMTAWCIQCHTRYNGQKSQDGNATASSLNDNSGGDAIFMFKHGTTGVGCEQCHVSHGTNVAMVAGTASAGITVPGSTTVHEDSALLKVNNRGTCNLCHDPTGTVTAGTYIGPSATPAP